MKKTKDGFFARISSWFFINWRFTFLLWISLVISGVFVYTNVIKREGFPPIQFPLTVISGTYFVDDVAKVDSEVAQPLYKILETVPNIETTQINSGPSFFSAVVQFEGDVLPSVGTSRLQSAIDSSNSLPEQVQLSYTTIDPAAFLNKYDLLLSVYSTDEDQDPASLQAVAEDIAKQLALADNRIVDAEVLPLITEGTNPQTGQIEARQTAFGQIGLQEDSGLKFYSASTIGVDRDKEELDIIQLSDRVKEILPTIDTSQFSDSYKVVISSDFADSIGNQISSLQSNLLTGLLAVALVSFLLITWRASIITGLFMISVMAVVITLLYFVGYTLNTITLFALVLSLGLFVDDATIVVEALDAQRKKRKDKLQIVKDAVTKVGAASFAGTMTTVLVFLPLVFVSGILGEFIRLMPVTVIISLITSLILSLTIIPFLSKFFLLNVEKDSWITRNNPISLLEERLSRFIGGLPLLLRKRPKTGKFVASAAISLSIVFVLLAGMFAQMLTFNIFPSSKDSDQIGFQVSLPPGQTIADAELVVSQINGVIIREIEPYVSRISYGRQAQPNERSFDAFIELTPFTERDVKSPEITNRLQTALDAELNDAINIRVLQFDAGPPAEEFPFKAQVYSEDAQKARQLTSEIIQYLDGSTIERQNGTTAQITRVELANEQIIARKDGARVFEVQAAFDADDTSALVIATEEFVREQFTPEYLEQSGFSEDDLTFDFGQESQNEESFNSLGIVFPLALLSMYILLTIQFRSALQPLLIFMAIPFSLLGVFAGLYFTDNSLSFFSMIGLIGLIGIAVNNTILLTDYANQERRAGKRSIEAISEATQKRFRPLITTTLTTVVALLPLAMSDPFWEALAYTIIFGLLSSTFLVLFAFPYYYLVAEWLRLRTNRLFRRVTGKKA